MIMEVGKQKKISVTFLYQNTEPVSQIALIVQSDARCSYSSHTENSEFESEKCIPETQDPGSHSNN